MEGEEIPMNEQQAQEILEKLARMDEQIKSLERNQEEIKELVEAVHKLAIAQERQGATLQSTKSKVDEVKADVDEIKSKPAKRWDAIIAALIAGVVGYVLARLGLK